MSWKEKMKEMGPANILFLSTDGASVNFIVVADPVPVSGTYQKKPQTRVGCPVVTMDGFVLFVCGKRTARKLASIEDKFKTHVINVTRHGVEGDTDTGYEVSALEDAALFKTLKGIAAKTFTEDALKEAIADAEDVMKR
jgi:hypothetical protein